MQSSFRDRASIAPGLDNRPVFNVVLAYEDFETGKHAKKTFDFLVQNLGDEYRLMNQMWKFDVLSIPKLREMAVKDALAADIIIISCRGGSALPMHVKIWVESWHSEKGNSIGLVALFDCPQEQTAPIRNYLADVAEKSRMEFFAQTDERSGEILNEVLPLHRGMEIPQRLTSVAGIVNRDVAAPPRWGINE